MKIHSISGYIQAIYLIEDEAGLMLLDGASRADVDVITAFISQKLKRPLSDLKYVIVTHMHPDHAGAANALRDKLGCKIVSGDVSGHWYSGLSGRVLQMIDIALAHWVANRLQKSRKSLWYPAKLTPDVPVSDGDSVPDFPDWKILFTQGHTDRDISVWHEPSNRIYVADLIVKVKGRYVPPFPVFHPNRYRRSVQKVIDLQPSSIMLAHGGDVAFTQEDYDYLLSQAPKKPKTPLRAVKRRLLNFLPWVPAS